MAHYTLVGQYGPYISIYGELNGGQGGLDWMSQEGDVFNLNTGEKLSLNDLFSVTEKEYRKVLYQSLSNIIEKQMKMDKNKGKYDLLIEASKEGREQLLLQFDKDNFYLSNDGLVIEYQKYVLTYGAGGIGTITIPYESISDILDYNILNILPSSIN